MTNNNRENYLEKIKVQLEILKKRINNMDKTLTLQEQTIDLIEEKSKDLMKEATLSSVSMSVEEIMKNAFSSKKLPKILKAS